MTMPWIRLTLPFAAALLPACAPTPDEVAVTISESASGSSSGGSGPTTTPPTTMTGEDTVGTQGLTGTDTTRGAVDDTVGTTDEDETTMGVGPTTSDGTSSSDGGESSSTGPVECVMPCGSNEECVGGECVEACGGSWGAGSYGYCLDGFGGFDTDAACGAGNLCVYWGDPITDVACSTQGCTTACDCPPPPATGHAIVTCGEITNPARMNDCYLSCAGGLSCPDGMMCNGGSVCVNEVPDLLPPFGDCNNMDAACTGSYCGTVPGGEGMCFANCNNVGDCPLAPSSGTAVLTCADVVSGDPGEQCYLDCSAGATCPDGMGCFGGVCLWENL